MDPKWIKWAKSLQAIAQNGLTYAEDNFDKDRYNKIRNIAAEILSTHSNVDLEIIYDLLNKEIGYSTPKVDVRGAVFENNKILLVREKEDGKWSLPGGWADQNETPSESIEREIFEESGLIVEAKKIIAVYDRSKQGHVPPFPYNVYKILFQCDFIGGKIKHSIETDGVDFFSENEIPELSPSRTTLNQIKRIFEQFRDPQLPVDFD
jgi:ADP-ribose pyrophosphatase YjhB (NUDIX family)